jgi:hypothetical protein
LPRHAAAGFRREINPKQSLRELCRKIASPKSGKVELLVFLLFGFVAVVATVCSAWLRLENQVAVVTGGARGIGAGIVRRFAQEGARVVFSDLLSEKGKVSKKNSAKT